MKKISVIGATLLAAAVLCAAPYIASSKFVFVRGQGASPYRATANARERCWRPPQAC